jgi:hypothetical protein
LPTHLLLEYLLAAGRFEIADLGFEPGELLDG